MNPLMPTRSKWGFSTPSKRLVEHDIKTQYKEQLLAQAASLLPDYAKLTDALMKNELHFADSMRAKNQLDGLTSAYMDEYNKNPFFSFSREGRNLTKQMASVVNDPTLQALSQQYKMDKARIEQADDDGVAPQFDVNEQGIRVEDKNGKVTRKFKLEEGDTPLTLDDTYHYINNIVGGSAGGFKYDMSSDKDLNSAIEHAFSNIGDEKVARDILDEGKRIVQSGNNKEVNARINWFLGQGITQGNLNRIYAEYARKAGRFDMNEAKKYALHYITDYANGVREASSDISYIDDVRKAHAGVGGGAEKQLALPTTYTSAILGGEGKRSLTLATPKGNITVGEGNILTNDIFKDAPKAYTEDGIENKSHKITDLDVFRKAIAQGAYIPVATTNRDEGVTAGEFKPVPKSAFNNMVISEREAPSLQVMIRDDKGNPASADDVQRVNAVLAQKKVVPQDLRKYFTVGADGNVTLNRGYFLHGQGLVPRKRSTLFGSTTAEDKEASDYFSNLGHNSIDDDLVRQEYNEYNGSKDKLGSATVGFDDQVYKVDVFIPVTNTEIFMGDKVRGTQDALLMGDTSRLQEVSAPVDRAYLGLAPFNQVSNPGRYSYFPNQ